MAKDMAKKIISMIQDPSVDTKDEKKTQKLIQDQMRLYVKQGAQDDITSYAKEIA